MRDGTEISGATESTYNISQTDIEHFLSVKASFIDGEGTSENITSALTDEVRPGDIKNVFFEINYDPAQGAPVLNSYFELLCLLQKLVNSR